MTNHEGNVIAELTADHREVEKLFEEYAALDAGNGDQRRRVADEFTIELVRHSVAEEQHLYPAVRARVPGGQAMADKEQAENARVEKLLKQIETADSAYPGFDTLVQDLIGEVSAHVEDEEDHLFPELVDTFTQEELFTLGDEVRATKKIAPTRPHPEAGDSELVIAGAGLVDRIRDVFTGRGGS